VLLDRLAIDQRTVGTVQVFKKGVGEDGHDDRMLTRDRKVVDLDVVLRLATDGQTLLIELNFLEHQAIHREDQFCHLAFPISLQTGQ